jgi:hypothetical protein
MRRWLVNGVIIVVATAALVGVLWNLRGSENTPEQPEGTHWLCGNTSCKHEFGLSIAQLGEHHQKHYNQPVPCPKCGQGQTVRATKCPTCSRLYPQVRGGSPCPYCHPNARKGGTKTQR